MSALTDAIGALETSIADLRERVAKLEKPVTPPVVTPPVVTPPVVVTPPKPAGKLDKLAMPARGFFSGASGWGDRTTNNGETTPGDLFGTWRGDPLDFFATWQDGPDGQHWGWGPSYTKTIGVPGLIDLAPGGPSDYAAAAKGSLDTKWRDYLTRLRVGRTIGGVLQPTIIRPSHEMNGDWYAWSVKPGMEANFKATMKRWRGILDEVYPEAIFALCFNGDHSSYPLKCDDLYEAGVWDLIGVDQYNIWPFIGTARNGTVTSWDAEFTKYKWDGAPRGIEAWRLWAKDRGLPIYHPEFANGGSDGDDPTWLAKRYTWAKANAGKGPGQFLGECWFNIAPGQYSDSYWLLGKDGTNPKTPRTVATYRDVHPIR